jgi:hypothetical protein
VALSSWPASPSATPYQPPALVLLGGLLIFGFLIASTDTWFLTRARLKHGAEYYGTCLGGFPERARALLGASIEEPVLHVRGGRIRVYSVFEKQRRGKR